MSYDQKRYVAIVVFLVGIAIGAIQSLGLVAFGLPPQAGAWLTVVSTVLLAAQTFLPRVQGDGVTPGNLPGAAPPGTVTLTPDALPIGTPFPIGPLSRGKRSTEKDVAP